jgi:hypothetical protein
MTQINTAIDSIKDAKTTALKTFVTDESIRKPLQAMVDAEAALAKNVAKAFQDAFSKFKPA